MGPFYWNKNFNEFDLEGSTCLLVLAGSRSYGTNTPESDWDYKGISIPPIRYLTSPFKNFDQTIWKSEEESGRLSEIAESKEKMFECTVFSLAKFFQLAIACNPNVIETLYVLPDHIIKRDWRGELLRNNRRLFLSKRAIYSFVGYSTAQLKRIESHRAWLLKPLEEEPTREQFGLPEIQLVNRDQMNACYKWIKEQEINIAPWALDRSNEEKEQFYYSVAALVAIASKDKGFVFDPNLNNWYEIEDSIQEVISKGVGLETNFMELLRKEKLFSQAKRHYQQYQQWKKTRNRDRAAMESAYGFDGKHGLHLVRLLRMGRELLTEGFVNVYRKDRDELLSIRNGAWTYQQLIDYANQETKELYKLVDNNKRVLPSHVDEIKLDRLFMEICN